MNEGDKKRLIGSALFGLGVGYLVKTLFGSTTASDERKKFNQVVDNAFSSGASEEQVLEAVRRMAINNFGRDPTDKEWDMLRSFVLEEKLKLEREK